DFRRGRAARAGDGVHVTRSRDITGVVAAARDCPGGGARRHIAGEPSAGGNLVPLAVPRGSATAYDTAGSSGNQGRGAAGDGPDRPEFGGPRAPGRAR